MPNYACFVARRLSGQFTSDRPKTKDAGADDTAKNNDGEGAHWD